MTLRLVVEPSVDADVAAAYAWLKERSSTAAMRFARSVRNQLLLIAQNPHQYQVTEIVVIACIHGRRDPATWQDRIRE